MESHTQQGNVSVHRVDYSDEDVGVVQYIASVDDLRRAITVANLRDQTRVSVLDPHGDSGSIDRSTLYDDPADAAEAVRVLLSEDDIRAHAT